MSTMFSFEKFEKDYLNNLKIEKSKFYILFYIIVCIIVIFEMIIQNISSMTRAIIIFSTLLLALFVFMLKLFKESDISFKEFLYNIISNRKELYFYKKNLINTLKEDNIKEFYQLIQIREHYKELYCKPLRKTSIELIALIIFNSISVISLFNFDNNFNIINIANFKIIIYLAFTSIVLLTKEKNISQIAKSKKI